MKYAVLIHYLFAVIIYSSSPLLSHFEKKPNFSEDNGKQD